MISLVQPPFYQVLTGIKNSNTFLGLRYIQSILKNNGYKCRLFNCDELNLKIKSKFKQFNSIEASMHYNISLYEKIMRNPSNQMWSVIADAVVKKNTRIVGITCLSHSLNSVKNMVRAIKKKNNNVTVVLGGIHSTIMPEQLLKFTQADIAVVGEGEYTFLELVQALDENRPLTKIQGLVIYTPGKIVKTQNRPLIQNLDEIPFQVINGTIERAYIMCTRGCPFGCTYCASNSLWGRKVRYRSVKNIIEEIKYLKSKNVKVIRFVDDTFTVSKKFVKELCTAIKKEKLNDIKISVGAHIETLDEQVIKQLKKAGVFQVTIGIESVSPKVQKIMNKKFDVERAKKIIHLLKKYELMPYIYFIIGFEDDDLLDIEICKNFLIDVQPAGCEVNVFAAYPGTGLWNQNEKKYMKAIDGNWYKLIHQGFKVLETNYDVDRETKKFMFHLKTLKWQKLCYDGYDIPNLYEMSRGLYSINNAIESLLIKMSKKNVKKIVLYGSDLFSEKLFIQSQNFGIKVTAVAVSFNAKGYIGNLKIKNIDQVKLDTVDAIVITSMTHKNAMKQTLKKCGVKSNKIYTIPAELENMYSTYYN